MRLPRIAVILLLAGCSPSELAAPPESIPGGSAASRGHGDRVVGGIGQFELPQQQPSACVTTCLSGLFSLRRVGELPLPVSSPWGVGDWDYDSDAGTWKLTDAFISLLSNGSYSSGDTHRAASGATINWVERGIYIATSDSIHFTHEHGGTWSAAISSTAIVVRWDDGRTFTYER
jgi:hypothetical protein